ncbi:MAG: nicotinamide-nucleotide amidohydrolase family protein [Caldisericia bacterium]
MRCQRSNLNQAYIPKGSNILHNSFGTAPGIKIETSEKMVILLPGPPRELEPMWNNHVLPALETDTKEFHKDFYILGLPESKMADILGNILNTENPISVAPYAGLGQIRLRVSAVANDEKDFDEKTGDAIIQVKKLLNGHVFDHPAPETLLKILREKGLSIATAESCTGGLIAKTLTDISGASNVFMGGAVTYSNQAKIDVLGVSSESLEKFGAVSKEVAKEMAQAAKRVFKTDVAISTTGIAGPTGGTAEKPVGLVYMGIATPNGVSVIKEVFTGTRDDVRIKTLMRVLWESIRKLS